MVVGKNNKMQNHINYRYTSLSHLDISVPITGYRFLPLCSITG